MVSGRISPARQATVTLFAQGSNGDSFTDNVTSDPTTGAFSDMHHTGFGGATAVNWTLQAHVDSDGVFAPLDGSCTYAVPPNPQPK
jgi:hypothetical protein